MTVEELVETALTITQDRVHPKQVNENFWRPKLMDLVEGAKVHLDANELEAWTWLQSPVEMPGRSVTNFEIAKLFGLLEDWDDGPLWALAQHEVDQS